jgi:type II secretory pathway pseudopilin PulG
MNAGRLIFGAIILAVVAAIIAGLVISGSPREQRLLRDDDERVHDLQVLSRTIERYYRETEQLPPDLGTLLNGWASSEIPRDPATDQEYGYEISGTSEYRLCADFALEAREDRQPEYWSHDGGRYCYSFDYSELVLD